ncbi:MAG: peptide ABC transporter substrate-binding protein, partial [Actinomycetota bacterium]
MTRYLRPALAVLVLLAACASGESPTERVIGAPAATVAEGTARITQRLVLTPPADTDATEVVITG